MRATALSILASSLVAPVFADTFEATVKPFFSGNCTACHNERLASGNLNLAAFARVNSITENRDDWDRIIKKIRSGEMPPKGMARPKTPSTSLNPRNVM